MLDDALSNVLAWTLLSAAAVLAVGVVAFRSPSRGLLSVFQHFAAGMILAAVGIGLLPNFLRWPKSFIAISAFAIGAVTVVAIKWTGLNAQRREPNALTQPIASPISVMAKVVICGLLIGLGIAEPQLGVLLGVAVTVEVLFLVLGRSAAMKAAPPRSKVLASSTLALLFLSGALAGSFISILHVVVLRMVLAFGAGTVSYFVTHELLIAPRERRQAPAMAGIFCLGFFALLVIDIVAE